MQMAQLFRWGAVAGFISAAAIIIGKALMLLEDEAPGEIADAIAPIFGLLAVVTVYLWQRDDAGKSGAAGFVVMFVGLALVAGLDFYGAFIRLEIPQPLRDDLMEGNPGIAFLASALIFLIGVVWFGASVIRSGVFPRLAGWGFIVGFVLVPMGEIVPEWVVAVGSIVAGLSVAWLSWVIWRGAGDMGSPRQLAAFADSS